MSEQKRQIPFTIIKNYRTNRILTQKIPHSPVQTLKKTKVIKKTKSDLFSIQQTGTKSQEIYEETQLVHRRQTFEQTYKVNLFKNTLKEDFLKKQFFEEEYLEMGIPFYGRKQELDYDSQFSTMKRSKLEQTRENIIQDNPQVYLWNDDIIF